MEIASWLGPYAGGTEYDEGRPYISAIDGPGGPIITGDHLTRDRPHPLPVITITAVTSSPNVPQYYICSYPAISPTSNEIQLITSHNVSSLLHEYYYHYYNHHH